MRAVLQRVRRASVHLPDGQTRSIQKGLLILLGIHQNDTQAQADHLAEKIARLRVFSNAEGKMDLSLSEVQGEMLVVSQFTLLGDCAKGRRPDFSCAAPPPKAQALYERFIGKARSLGTGVQTGEFGALMQVELVNDGPVTLILET